MADNDFVTTHWVNAKLESATPAEFSDSRELATTMWVRARLGHPDALAGWDDSNRYATVAWFEAFLAAHGDITPEPIPALSPATAVAPRGMYLVWYAPRGQPERDLKFELFNIQDAARAAPKNTVEGLTEVLAQLGNERDFYAEIRGLWFDRVGWLNGLEDDEVLDKATSLRNCNEAVAWFDAQIAEVDDDVAWAQGVLDLIVE